MKFRFHVHGVQTVCRKRGMRAPQCGHPSNIPTFPYLAKKGYLSHGCWLPFSVCSGVDSRSSDIPPSIWSIQTSYLPNVQHGLAPLICNRLTDISVWKMESPFSISFHNVPCFWRTSAVDPIKLFKATRVFCCFNVIITLHQQFHFSTSRRFATNDTHHFSLAKSGHFELVQDARDSCLYEGDKFKGSSMSASLVPPLPHFLID